MDLADGMIPITEHFVGLEEPRGGCAKHHELLDIIVITRNMEVRVVGATF